MSAGRRLLGRMVAATTCVTFVAGAVAGCSMRPDAPRELQLRAANLADSVEAIPGIQSADATVEDVDFKDKPGERYIQLTATAISPAGIDSLPSRLAPVLDDARQRGSTIRLDLRIPGSAGIAPTTLSELSVGMTRTVEALRSTPGILSVNGTAYAPRLYASTTSTTPLISVLPLVRDALRTGGDVVPSVVVTSNAQDAVGHISVDVSRTWPSAELGTALEQIQHLNSLRYLSASQPEKASRIIIADISDPAEVAAVSDLLSKVSSSGDGTPTTFLINGPDGEQVHGTI